MKNLILFGLLVLSVNCFGQIKFINSNRVFSTLPDSIANYDIDHYSLTGDTMFIKTYVTFKQQNLKALKNDSINIIESFKIWIEADKAAKLIEKKKALELSIYKQILDDCSIQEPLGDLLHFNLSLYIYNSDVSNWASQYIDGRITKSELDDLIKYKIENCKFLLKAYSYK